MKPTAIVYVSQTGFTREYARMLGQKLSLPVYSLQEAAAELPAKRPVIYLGWLHASHVKGYRKAAKRYELCAVCGVGLCDTGTLTEQVRKATAIPEEIPLFTLQGGFSRGKLKGMDKLMISMLTKGLAAQQQPTEQDARMLELLRKDASYVCEEHLKDLLDWYGSNL